MADLQLPANLAHAAQDPERAAWLAGLSAAVDDLRRRWSLTEIGEPFEPGGTAAWVAPVRDRHRCDRVLKVAFHHYEARDEAAGLREWDGLGAVRVLADTTINETTGALLLERCRPGASLTDRPHDEQDRVIGDLLPRLWRSEPFSHPFRPLSEMCDDWIAAFRQRTAGGLEGGDPGLVRAGLALFAELPRTAERGVLLCTDLHAGNVISVERERWLAIDPKPYVGDRTYDALQHMLNHPDRLAVDPHGFARQMAARLDLDPQRLTCWLFARCVVDCDRWSALRAVARRLAPA